MTTPAASSSPNYSMATRRPPLCDRRLGVTTPLSFEAPSATEQDSTDKLLQFLADSHLHKSEQESARQKDALNSLEEILKDWVIWLATTHRKPIAEAIAKLFTFGSYHLQVDRPGDAIDTLCVGPNFVNRQHDFFNVLRVKLEQMKNVTKMECERDAHIPFMKFELNGVSINLVYASISFSRIREDLDVTQRDVLNDIDDVTARSLNGHRVSAQILKLVPDIKNFRRTLRCVKYWAKTRDICSNVTGFLGDCDWAILVARVCQLYPCAVPSTLVNNFFELFSEWKWPDPVMLCLIDNDEPLRFSVWDSRKVGKDRDDLMPIITPAYPCKNSRTDASESTIRVITEHFKLGHAKCTDIKNGEADWADLFKPFNFFEAYVQYLHVDIMADNHEGLMTLKKMIEPELRQLMSKIEEGGKLICYLCPIEYARRDCCAFFIGLLGKGIVDRVPDAILEEFKRKFNSWMKPGMELQCYQVFRPNIKSHKWGKQSMPVLQVPYTN